MKALIIETGGWGGISHYTYGLTGSLADIKGIEASLLTDNEYELDSFPRNFKFIKKSIRGVSHFKAIYGIIGVIIKTKPDVIHVQSLISARKDWLLFIIARLFNLNIILTVHNALPHEDFEKKALFMPLCFKIIYSCAKRIIVHAQYSKDKLISHFNIPSQKIKVISFGNYLFIRRKDLSQNEARRILGISGDLRVILVFGAIREYKGIDVILKAFKLLSREEKNVLLLIVGKPINVDINHYKNMIEEFGLMGKVLLVDKYISLGEIPHYFFASDVVALPYKEIDMSGSLHLAYAFGKPVIAARTGGLIENVEDNENGILVKPEDPGEFKNAIQKILFNDELLKKMGDMSFVLAKDRYSWKEIAEKTVEVYKEIY